MTERAILMAVRKAEPAVMKHYLRKWLKAQGLDGDELDIQNVLDCKYNLDSLGKRIQKIITIPAALQKIEIPVPCVPHPDWLTSKVHQLYDHFEQRVFEACSSQRLLPERSRSLLLKHLPLLSKWKILVKLQGDQSILLFIKQDGRGDVDLRRLRMQRNQLMSQKLACLSSRKVSVIGWYKRKRHGESRIVRGSIIVLETKDSAKARL